jgi:hypothetical protein
MNSFDHTQSTTPILSSLGFFVKRSRSHPNALAQQVITEDQADFAQLVQLAQLRNVPIPLSIRAKQVQPVLQFARVTGTDATNQALNIISEHTAQSLATVQAAQTATDVAVSGFAQTRLSVLQARSALLAQLAGGASTSTPTAGAVTGTGMTPSSTGAGT